MNKVALGIFLFVGLAVPSRGQSAADLSSKYSTITAYEVRPGIMLTPFYAADGQVCEMVLERHTSITKTKTMINFDSTLSKELEKELVDELAPQSERGKELTGFDNWFGSVTIDGPFVITKYTYENVSVEVHGITRSVASGDTVIVVQWRNRVCNSKGQQSATVQNPPSNPGASKTPAAANR